jgi:fumarate hydratase class I
VAFLKEKILTLGTSACPPYHLAIVIGGTSAELVMKTVKLASTRYLDALPTEGSEAGHAFRDLAMEKEIHELTQALGVGAQFGGKYFCHDVRVIRLPRHGASLPIGLGVSCSADRQAKGKITREGVFLEALETNPARFLPDIDESALGGDVVRIDLNRPMAEILATLSQHSIKTRLSLTGSFGPTTAGRMDAFVAQFQAAGGSMVMLAKGNRSAQVRETCKAYGGFYLGSIGGPAARLAQDCIRKVEVLEYPELGMEAIWRIEVENFPAFIVIDDKGNDFFKDLNLG